MLCKLGYLCPILEPRGSRSSLCEPGGHIGSGSRVTVCGRGSGIWLTVVPAGGRHSVLILEHSWQFAAIKVIAAKGAGRAGGAGCRGAAVSGCAGGPGGRRAGDHGGAPVRGGAAD